MVPANPERIVALEPGEMVFHLVDVGLTSVGVTTDVTTVGGNFPALLGTAVQPMQLVGDSTAPNALKEGRVIELDAMLARSDYGYVGLQATLDMIVQGLPRS
ncbi:MAG: hypothetical protein HC876_20010 [Chloroflexaceae bacterium]|nr:hypothetical protein [Chloroflexaceae bacterium]